MHVTNKPPVIHMVVRKHVVTKEAIVCTKSDTSDEPAVYADSVPAELRCAELRDRWLGNSQFANTLDRCPYTVLDIPVL